MHCMFSDLDGQPMSDELMSHKVLIVTSNVLEQALAEKVVSLIGDDYIFQDPDLPGLRAKVIVQDKLPEMPAIYEKPSRSETLASRRYGPMKKRGKGKFQKY